MCTCNVCRILPAQLELWTICKAQFCTHHLLGRACDWSILLQDFYSLQLYCYIMSSNVLLNPKFRYAKSRMGMRKKLKWIKQFLQTGQEPKRKNRKERPSGHVPTWLRSEVVRYLYSYVDEWINKYTMPIFFIVSNAAFSVMNTKFILYLQSPIEYIYYCSGVFFSTTCPEKKAISFWNQIT